MLEVLRQHEEDMDQPTPQPSPQSGARFNRLNRACGLGLAGCFLVLSAEVLKSYRRVNPCDADSTMDLKISGLPVFRGRLAHVSCGHPEPHTNEASALDCVGLELGMSNVCQSGPRK